MNRMKSVRDMVLVPRCCWRVEGKNCHLSGVIYSLLTGTFPCGFMELQRSEHTFSPLTFSGSMPP